MDGSILGISKDPASNEAFIPLRSPLPFHRPPRCSTSKSVASAPVICCADSPLLVAGIGRQSRCLDNHRATDLLDGHSLVSILRSLRHLGILLCEFRLANLKVSRIHTTPTWVATHPKICNLCLILLYQRRRIHDLGLLRMQRHTFDARRERQG